MGIDVDSSEASSSQKQLTPASFAEHPAVEACVGRGEPIKFRCGGSKAAHAHISSNMLKQASHNRLLYALAASLWSVFSCILFQLHTPTCRAFYSL